MENCDHKNNVNTAKVDSVAFGRLNSSQCQPCNMNNPPRPAKFSKLNDSLMLFANSGSLKKRSH